LFDLSKNNLAEAAEAGFEFELRVPGTNEATGAFVTVRGSESKKVKEYARKTYNQIRMKEQALKKRGKDPEEMTLEEAEELAIDSAIVRVISWRGIAEAGEEVQFTKENAQRIFKEHSWIREQIMEESQQLLNFRPD
jgi:hypothetical protein